MVFNIKHAIVLTQNTAINPYYEFQSGDVILGYFNVLYKICKSRFIECTVRDKRIIFQCFNKCILGTNRSLYTKLKFLERCLRDFQFLSRQVLALLA